MGMAHLAASSCPCTVNEDNLMACTPHSIENFPEDLKDCSFDRALVETIQLNQQPFTLLRNQAFVDFFNLKELGIMYCQNLNQLEPQAFDGLSNLNGLFIEHTNLSYIPTGSLDGLTHLMYLDIQSNPLQSPYVTQAWHFCRKLEDDNHGMIYDGEMEVEKFLWSSSNLEQYCVWMDSIGGFVPAVDDKCIKENNTYRCDWSAMEALACELDQPYTVYSDVIFDFPASPLPVEDFSYAETNTFIKEFNYNSTEATLYGDLMAVQRLYGTKLDLSEILQYTSNKTQKIIIHADTVHMTQPVTQPIHFDIFIRSRVASINHPIPMRFTRNQLFEGFETEGTGEEVERFTILEEHVNMSPNLTMRLRKFGRIEILDSLPEEVAPSYTTHQCVPYNVNITDYIRDIHSWFDETSINLNYIGARTLLTKETNPILVSNMTEFHLNYVKDANTVDNQRAIVASQQFVTIQQLLNHPDSHNVPIYTLGTIQQLADVLYDELTVYRDDEIATELELFIAQGRLHDMQIQFSMVQLQQQLYIDAEMEEMDRIFNLYNESSQFNFEHREAIKNETEKALNLILEYAFTIKSQEYEHMLDQAEDAKMHYEATVNKYRTEVERFLDTAQREIELENDIMNTLDVDVNSLNYQLEEFEKTWKNIKTDRKQKQ